MAELPEPTETTRAAVATESVPILDLSAYMNGDAGAREQAAADLRYIQENLGYYYITNHGVSAELIERSFEKVAEFFALPEVEKRKILVNRHQLGFVPAKASIMKTELTDANTVADLNEGLSLMRERAPDDPKVVADVRFSGLNPWPDGVPGLRETFLEYHVEMDALAKRLLPLYALALDKPADYFDPYFADAHYYNRNTFYPAAAGIEGQQGVGSHTDHNFMALLPMSAEPGLEYATPSGDWFEAPMVPGAVVVNTGVLEAVDQRPVPADATSGHRAQARSLCADVSLQPQRRDRGRSARYVCRARQSTAVRAEDLYPAHDRLHRRGLRSATGNDGKLGYRRRHALNRYPSSYRRWRPRRADYCA